MIVGISKRRRRRDMMPFHRVNQKQTHILPWTQRNWHQAHSIVASEKLTDAFLKLNEQSMSMNTVQISIKVLDVEDHCHEEVINNGLPYTA